MLIIDFNSNQSSRCSPLTSMSLPIKIDIITIGTIDCRHRPSRALFSSSFCYASIDDAIWPSTSSSTFFHYISIHTHIDVSVEKILLISIDSQSSCPNRWNRFGVLASKQKHIRSYLSHTRARAVFFSCQFINNIPYWPMLRSFPATSNK